MFTNKIVTACALMLAVSNSQATTLGSVHGMKTSQLYIGTPSQDSWIPNNFVLDTTQSYTSVAPTFYNVNSSSSAVSLNDANQTLTWVAHNSISYDINGTLTNDTVCLAKDSTCVDQFTFFLTETSSPLADLDLDGIMGLAPGTESQPSFVEALYNSTQISVPQVTLAYGANASYAIYGEFNQTKYTDSTWSFNSASTDSWALSIGSVYYGSKEISKDTSSAQLATAMKGIALPQSDFENFYAEFSTQTNFTFLCNGTHCNTTTPCENYSYLPDLTFAIGESYFNIPSAGYLDHFDYSNGTVGCELNVYPTNQTQAAFGQYFLKSFFVSLDYSEGLPIQLGVNTNSTVYATVTSSPPAGSGLGTWGIVLIVLAGIILLAIVIHCIHKHKKSQTEGSDDRYQAA